jgi:ATP-binding cassette, subfamily B, bacterial PglK
MLKRLSNNLIFLTFRRCSKLLTPNEKSRSLSVGIFSLISAFVDVAGMALLIPVMIAATDQTIVQRSSILWWLHETFHFQNHGNFMVFLAGALLLVFIAKNSVVLWVGRYQAQFSYDVATNLARRQFMKYYNWGFTYLKDKNSADVLNNIVNIPIFFVGGVLISLINFLTELAVIVIIVVGIAMVDYALFGALALVLLPSGLMIYNLTKNKLYNLGLEQQRLSVLSFSRIYQSIFGFVDVRLTNKEAHFLEAYSKEQRALNESYKVKHIINLVPSKALEVIAVLGILVIFVYAFNTQTVNTEPASTTPTVGSSTAVIAPKIEPAAESIFTFVAIFATAAFRVLPSMNRCLAAVMSIKNQLFALEVLEDGELPLKMDRMDVHAMAFEESIEFRDLRFTFQDSGHVALNGFNFTVKKGEKIGIIGESGSGKTTLMNLLLRFLQEDDGGIFVDGKKINYEDIASWRAKVGYVQQQVFLIDASLKENVAFGESPEEIDLARLEIALEQASLMDFVRTLPHGWDSQVGEMGARLSGGQRQRIGIARALYYNSSVLIFDEATSALDNETENSITESIQSLQEDKTVFVVAHRITTLRNCDRIIELKDGKLLHTWTYAELIEAKMH